MGKKFMGLDGTDHFWDRAKAWILNQITSAGMDKQSIIDAVYPVGSLYWSSKDTDPSTLFGGTWVQIKDRFVLACGDTYNTTGATGGASSVTLTTPQIPSHTHKVTATGSISVTTNPTFTGTEVTSNNESAHESFAWSGSHRHTVYSGNPDGRYGDVWALNKQPDNGKANFIGGGSDRFSNNRYVDTAKNSGKPFIENTTISVSGPCTGDHTHKVTAKGTISGGAYKFTGTEVTSDATGGGQAHENMPPYIVKYCWERTA